MDPYAWTFEILTCAKPEYLDHLVLLRLSRNSWLDDTRTILLRCVEDDQHTNQSGVDIGWMEGCVMTFYPASFRQKLLIEDLYPRRRRLSIFDWENSLPAVILQELSHYRFGHHSTDVKLLRANIPVQFRTDSSVSQPCYGSDSCLALAASAQKHEAIRNADTFSLIVIALVLTRAYPERILKETGVFGGVKPRILICCCTLGRGNLFVISNPARYRSLTTTTLMGTE